MSNKTYNKLWLETVGILESLVKRDSSKAKDLTVDKSTEYFIKRIGTNFLRYIGVAHRLETCHDLMVHPQKRRLVRHMLEGVMGRVLELKSDLVSLTCSDFHYLDSIAIDLGLQPEHCELPIPSYYRKEKGEEEQYITDLVADLMEKYAPKNPVKAHQAASKSWSLERAALLIQRHERARRGRLRHQAAKEVRQREAYEAEMLAMKQKQKAPTMKPEEAAVFIQKHWRGRFGRKRLQNLKLIEHQLLRMATPPPPDDPESAPQYQSQLIAEERYRIQEQHERDYKAALVSVKKQLYIEEGPEYREKLQDEIRAWYRQYLEENGEYPTYPSEEEGGSLAQSFMAGLTPSATAESPQTSIQETLDEDKNEKKPEEAPEEEVGFRPKQSRFIEGLSQDIATFKEVWKDRDESHNPQQTYEVDLIKDEKRGEMQADIRLEVDEVMRQELEVLNAALLKDHSKKTKKQKKSKKGKKGGKKAKRIKDLTADRTLESLVQELVEQGIIRSYPRVRMAEFIGEPSLCGGTPLGDVVGPTLGDIKRLLTEYCILPLGSKYVHQSCPLVRSVLLAGPEGSGKSTLIAAVCTEVGATLMDLSPANLAGRYLGKAGLNMLVHLVAKVSKLVQPTVIKIETAERVFMKKVPKSDTTDPKRLKKDLPRIVKGIAHGDRVVVMGVTHSPFEAELKALSSCYNKILVFPKPDYGTRFALWKKLILLHGGVIGPTLNFSLLCKVSDGYASGHIATIVNKVMTRRRVANQAKFPLAVRDFSNLLHLFVPIYREEEEAFREWWFKTPLGKKRFRQLNPAETEDSARKDKKGKKK